MSNGLPNPFSNLPLILKRWPGLTVLGPLLLVLGLGFARAQDVDEEYLHVYSLIQQADSLNESGKTAPALAKYREAQTAILNFQRAHPAWNASVLTFRANYVAEKISSLAEKAPAAGASDSASAGGVQVKLTEPGSEPRQKLRLHPKPGDKQTVSMTTKTGMAMKMGEMENPPMKLPAINMMLELTVKNVSPEGDINYDSVVTDIGVAEEEGSVPQMVSAMKTALAGLKGMSGSGTFSSRGINKGTQIKVPSDANPQAKQAMDQMKETVANMVAPLPEEPAGAGAKWQVKMPIKSQGMNLEQTAVYEIVSIEGDQVSTKVTLTQTAPNQKISNPAMPALKLDLTKMNGKGSGEITFDLSKVAPPQSTLNSHSDFTMAMNSGGQKQTMSMSMDINLHVEAK